MEIASVERMGVRDEQPVTELKDITIQTPLTDLKQKTVKAPPVKDKVSQDKRLVGSLLKRMYTTVERNVVDDSEVKTLRSACTSVSQAILDYIDGIIQTEEDFEVEISTVVDIPIVFTDNEMIASIVIKYDKFNANCLTNLRSVHRLASYDSLTVYLECVVDSDMNTAVIGSMEELMSKSFLPSAGLYPNSVNTVLSRSLAYCAIDIYKLLEQVTSGEVQEQLDTYNRNNLLVRYGVENINFVQTEEQADICIYVTNDNKFGIIENVKDLFTNKDKEYPLDNVNVFIKMGLDTVPMSAY